MNWIEVTEETERFYIRKYKVNSEGYLSTLIWFDFIMN